MKKSHLLLFSLLILILASCKDKMTCPAFQSMYILDDTEREKFFSLFGEDSLPKMVEVKRNKYGIAKRVSYRKKLNSLRTVKMENVYAKKKTFDSTTQLPEQDFIALQDVQQDSMLQAVNANVYHYNVEQDNYMRLFGQYLVEAEKRKKEQFDAANKVPEKKGFFNFLKKRKKEEVVDSTIQEQPVEEVVDEFATSDEISGMPTQDESIDSASVKETKKEKKRREKRERKKNKKKESKVKEENGSEENPEVAPETGEENNADQPEKQVKPENTEGNQEEGSEFQDSEENQDGDNK